MIDNDLPEAPDYVPADLTEDPSTEDLAPAEPRPGTRATVANLIRDRGHTAVEIAGQVGVSMIRFNQLVASLRDGRTEGGGPGQPSSGPTDPLAVMPVYDKATGRHEWIVAETQQEAEDYLALRERGMYTAVKRAERMFSSVPDEVIPSRATRRLLRNLREELEERMAVSVS